MPRLNSKTVALSRVLVAICVAMIAPSAPAIGETATPAERVKAVPKGELKNPLAATPEIIAEGKALYQAKTCSACHGGNGGGIHCPSLINDAWIYGSDDDTIFRLVTVGSEQMLSQGYSRGDQEKHAGPMPGFGDRITDEQEIWKIVTYLRSLKPAASAN